MQFNEFRAEVFAKYQEGQFEAALAVIDREMANFPDQVARIGDWRASLFAALGQHEHALAALQAAIAGGAWYSEQALAMDDSLKSVRELPGYQQVLAVCRERHAAALLAAKPELTVRFDEAAATPAPLVLALHGNMSSAAASAAEWAPAVAQGCYVGLAQSTQIEGPDMFVWDDAEKAEAEVLQHYRTLVASPAVDPGRTVLGGFSMGGGVVVRTALKGALPVRGFIAVGPYIPDMEPVRAALEGARERGVRGYILIGEKDQVCWDHAHELFSLMRAHDIPVEMEVLPGVGHAFPPDFAQRFQRALQFVLA